MKIVGKMGDSYMITASKEEITQIVFGERYVHYNDKIKTQVYAFHDEMNKGETEIKVHKIFNDAVELYHTHVTEGRDNILAKIDAIKGLLTPIQAWINEPNQSNQP